MKNKVNLFDLLVLIILISFSALLFFSFLKKEKTYSQKVEVVFEASGNDQVFEEAKKQQEVFFNSVNKSVLVKSVERANENIKITLEAPGEKKGDAFIFNGQRILLNQKAEIHSTYFLQGKITSIEYAK